MSFFNFKRNILIASACLSVAAGANAAVSLDRTRVIFNGSEKSMSLNIVNENQQLPYLAQAWLENAKMEKSPTGPIVITPPVQRLEPGAKSQIRLTATPAISQLPQDKESLFYFNLREIPPKSDKANTLQIALQTQVKLFYRPASITPKMNEEWQSQIVLRPEAGGYLVSNPTPYYVTVIGLGNSKKDAEQSKFEAVMLAPKSEQKVKATVSNTPWMTFINDFGGRPTFEFPCSNGVCKSAVK